jgi:VanZ family protein
LKEKQRMGTRENTIHFAHSKYSRGEAAMPMLFQFRTLAMRLVFLGYFAYLTLLLLVPNPFPWVSASPKVLFYLDLIYPIAHCLSFAFLTGLALLAFRSVSASLIVSGLMVYASATELAQMFCPPRCAEWLDWFQDILGIALGVLLVWALSSSWRWLRGIGGAAYPETSS